MVKPPDYFPDILDSSMLSTFKSCPQKFYKEYILNYKPKELSVHLHAGAAFARGLEVTRRAFYEENLTSENSIALGLRALLAHYGDYQCPADSAKSAERMAGAFEYYFQNYALNHDDAYPVLLPGGKRGIEYSFAEPLPLNNPLTGNPILYTGRMDAIIHYAGNTLICDEKTTTQLGATWSRQWDLRAQFTGYAWGCERGGVKVDGAIVRGVAIRKTGFDTTQAITYRPEWQIARWYEETLEWVRDILIAWETGRWRYNLDHSCADYGGCGFRLACQSQDEEPWLSTGFEKRIWNPLLRTEIKV
jgi:hypothetical protein